MYINNILSRNRRDIEVQLKCHCGFSYVDTIYDDEHFHNNIVPKIKCPKCGQIEADSPSPHIPLKPKYPEGFQI